MWKIIYNILVNIALPFFIIISLFKKKIRKNLYERLFNSTKTNPLKNAIWIHGASIGEVVIAESIINFIRKTKKEFNMDFLVTTNTFYARDMVTKRFNKSVTVSSSPLDLTYTIERFIDSSTFKILIIVETEIWPNLIWTAKKHNIPVVIVNGRISDKALPGYTRFSFFLKHVLSCIDMVVTQSEEHRQRYISIGMEPTNVITTGNIKYFREIPEMDESLEKADIVTFGSIKEKELDFVYKVIKRLKHVMPFLKIYIAPRELHLAGSMEEELKKDYRIMRYSALKKEKKDTYPEEVDFDVVIVDTVGDLLGIYKMSRVAFVGGSLAPYGGQNILEPLFFSTPVLFGPYMENFKEISEMVLERNAGFMVKDHEDLFERMRYLLENRDVTEKMGRNGIDIIQMHRGYMENTIEAIWRIMEKGKQ